MNGLSRGSIVGFVAVIAVIALQAQQAQVQPRAAYVYPAGGQQGTAFEVRVGGRSLNSASGALVSGAGVHASVTGYDRPLNGQQLTELREKVQELQKQLGNTPAFQQESLPLRLRIGDSVRRNANPALAEIVTVRVTVDGNAELGTRELRLVTPAGITNPLVFCVGEWPEFRENDEKRTRADAELPITLPAIVNGRMIPGDIDRLQVPARQPGQYAPGDVDRYRFHAQKGQDLVFAVSARDLMPYLADAVPGWFQATLALFDAHGKEVAYEDDFRFQPDPVMHYRVPVDGDYVLEIKDALYRGRDDFVYRIAMGEIPYVTDIFPLGARAGSKVNAELTGWNLSAARMTLDATRLLPGVHQMPAVAGKPLVKPASFEIDTLPEIAEHETNDMPRRAEHLELPVIVNGRIESAGDRDVFSFTGRAGEQVVAEVIARRLGSPLDSVLELIDQSGKRVAFNDDHQDKAFGLITHQADSYLSATLPATGTYLVRVSDRQHRGGREYAYRLRVGGPRPDFTLRIAPSSIVVPGSGSVPVTVCAIRRDGFAGDISLSVKDGQGFSLSGAVVPAGQDQVRMTLTAPASLTKEPISLRIEGRATVAGKLVVRQAAPAEDMMQAFAWHQFVRAGDLRVAVTGRGATRIPPRITSSQPVRIPSGGRTTVTVTLPPAYSVLENIAFELSEPPDGISLRDAAVSSQGLALIGRFVLQADALKLKPAARGNLIVTVSGVRVQAAQAASTSSQPPPRRRVQVATLPAIAFEIVERR